MKATYILLIFLSTTCFSQKLQLVFGIGPTYSITNDNINYTIAPSYLPTSTIEDPRLSEKYETKSIDWIQNKNYFGIEPYCRIGYKLGETF
ncbi:MAG TPA: hypothetical protein VFV79_09850, partial [Saprospiraceae bacterium]|nr:hypothetical protein [Saprospiraceae bacterium]